MTYDSIKSWVGIGFSSNGFNPMKAAFNGLFSVSGDEANPASSGAFSLYTTAKGQFSGRLQSASGKYAFSGVLDANGAGRAHVTRGMLGALDLRFQIEPTTQDTLGGTVTDGDWTADLYADRVVFDGKTAFAPQQGKYTFIISGDPSSGAEPGGNSFGTIKIDRAGRIRAIGSLADGTKFAQIAPVSAAGQWPFFLSLYGGKGCAVGWLTVESTDTQDVSGEVNWSKPPLFNTKLYPGGFVVQRQLSGSAYSAPPKGVSILNLPNGQVLFEGADLQQSFSEPIALDANNRVTDLGADKLRLIFRPLDGTFSGRVTDPLTGSTKSCSGVALQKQNAGGGYFVGGAQTGRMTVGQ